MTTKIEEKVNLDPVLETDTPILTHIIDRGNDERPAEAIVLEARICGLKLTALCGIVMTPSRDPIKHPVCPKCEEMFEFAADFRDC